MDHFNYRGTQLFAEDIAVQELAENYGTPLYVYSRATIERHWHAFDQAAGDQPHLICYAVKASSNIAILNVLARLGSGFDIVSAGELARVIEAGGDPAKVVFSGVAKTHAEIEYALQVGIKCFNIESAAEMQRIADVAAELNVAAPISIRVNPDIDAKTHPYISTGLKANKFGVDIDTAMAMYQQAHANPHLNVQGIDCHIGSQLTDIQPFLDALDRVLAIVDNLADQGIALTHLDVGGGLGVTYENETPPHPQEYAAALAEKMQGRALELIFEPGRAIMANAGILVSKVEYLKPGDEKNFAIIDAAMNDLIRPALYSAWMNIIEVEQKQRERQCYDIVGPICETGDFIGKDRELAIASGDFIAVRSAGAYGFTMSSNYNSRGRAAEIMVDGDASHLIRRRETLDDLWRGEACLPE